MTRFQSETAVYRAVQQLGKGGMGITHLVRREDDGAELVLKELRIELLEDWKTLELFEREIAILETLDHPGIPRYVDKIVDRETGMVALVQTRVAGRTLAELMQARQSMSADRFAELLQQCLEILAYLHERVPPIVHRDVSPRNLMIDDARAYLIDFGAVKLPWNSTTLTSVGTFGYMPPEQLLGEAEPASDLYALGMTFIALATGREPTDLPKDRRTGQVAPASVLDVREPIRGVLLDMVRPGLDGRLGNAREALARLREPPSRRRRTRVGRRVLAAILMLPALVLGVGWGMSRIPAEHEVMTLGGWFTGHGHVASAVEATLLHETPLTSPVSVAALAFRPDGKGVISCARDGALAWDLGTGQVTARHEAERRIFDHCRVVQFTDDGSAVVAATFHGGVSLHDADTLSPLLATPRLSTNRKLLDIRARSTDDILLAVFAEEKDEGGSYRANVVVSEVTTSRTVFTDEVGWNYLDGGDLSGDGRYLAIVGGHKSAPKWLFQAIVWNVDEGRVCTVEQSDHELQQVVLSQDGSRMATLDVMGIDVWDTTTCERQRMLGVGQMHYDAQLAADADLSTVVVTTSGGAQIYDGVTGHLRQTVNGHSLRVSAVALSADGGMIATGSEDQTIKLWSTVR